ncbi:hypothetical protein HJC23_005216 [Cyclotella cryptica]|uniref:G domain-containing protein n=1 Tax=Cyclotella cryptica TaxID=29204 RepID=A0ABD3P473_9STRA|eukprot:CCRYP_017794-RA/>CCRYP_017794-RA protein AED:0.23 eAED:0.23 QI:264/1/1/1/0.66/0.5/4/1293/657
MSNITNGQFHRQHHPRIRTPAGIHCNSKRNTRMIHRVAILIIMSFSTLLSHARIMASSTIGTRTFLRAAPQMSSRASSSLSSSFPCCFQITRPNDLNSRVYCSSTNRMGFNSEKLRSPSHHRPNHHPSLQRSIPHHLSTQIRPRTTTTLHSTNPETSSDPPLSTYQRPKVNWYPGHIAKAERQLSETLKSVDVVIEVRDARAPKATSHPKVGEWSAGRPRVVVLTRMDAVTGRSREGWMEAYRRWGADRGWEELGGVERNRNEQFWRERRKYVVGKDEREEEEEEENVYGGAVEEVLFVDAKRGQGTHAISRAVYRAGRHVNERRRRRGLNDRPLRVGIIGFPNVGKSALINRLFGRRRAKTANTPGVTRSLQWIRVATDKYATSASGSSGVKSSKSGFELLDSPGIIPSDMIDQNDALLLAACNSVGVGAYDNQAVAAYLCDRIQALVLAKKDSIAAPQWRSECISRYGFDPILPLSKQNIAARWGSENTDGSASNWIEFAAANQDRIPTGEDMLFIVADNACQGDPENAARKILQDFRMGRMGPISLQLAPETEAEDGQMYIESLHQDGLHSVNPTHAKNDLRRATEEMKQKQQEEIVERAAAARDAAKMKGLDLPPVLEDSIRNDGEEQPVKRNDDSTSKPPESEVGKGLFDGW